MPGRKVAAVTYHVRVERDESGAWIARVTEVPGCHTYGRTLRQVRIRILEALALWVDHAESAELEFDVRLPAQIRRQLQRLGASRARAERAQQDIRTEQRLAATGMIAGMGLSLRDAADLMGLSHQRVQQLVGEQASAQ